MTHELSDRVQVVELYDAYGALLTPKQRRLLRLYYLDDLSLGEIAQRLRITRQAVHDSLKRSVADLRRYESKLGIITRRGREARVREALGERIEALEQAVAASDDGDAVARIVRDLRALRERL